MRASRRCDKNTELMARPLIHVDLPEIQHTAAECKILLRMTRDLAANTNDTWAEQHLVCASLPKLRRFAYQIVLFDWSQSNRLQWI